jgi:hypothetical protein
MIRRRFNFAQRVVVVIGLGVALYLFGSWVTNLGSHLPTGWAAFAPLSGASLTPFVGGLHPWVRLVLWLMLTVVWMVSSLFLVRSPRDVRGD